MKPIDKSRLKYSIKEQFNNWELKELIGDENSKILIKSIDNELAFNYIIDLSKNINKWIGKKEKLNNFELQLLEYQIKQGTEKLVVFLFKQRKILIAVPQRKRHPTFPAPNLGGLATPQSYRLAGEVCYGLNYCDARTDLVKKALSNPDITDILFVDDDILLPLDAISILCDTNESIVAANYVKKQFPIETTALQIQTSNGITHNKEIKAIQNDLTPTPVSQVGLGACLISLDVFRKMKEPWFEFIYNKDGSVFASEDVRFCQKAILDGFIPKVVPGLVPIHVKFKDGSHWGPDWLVKDFQIKEEFKPFYCYMQCDPEECYSEDIKGI